MMRIGRLGEDGCSIPYEGMSDRAWLDDLDAQEDAYDDLIREIAARAKREEAP